MNLPKSITGHRMVTLEEGKLFIVGGKHGNVYRKHRTNEILQLTCDGPTPNTCRFQVITPALRFAREDHIALPIIDSFASQLCS